MFARESWRSCVLPWRRLCLGAIDITCISNFCATILCVCVQRSSAHWIALNLAPHLSLPSRRNKSLCAFIDAMKECSCDQRDILRRDAASLGLDNPLLLSHVMCSTNIAPPSTDAHAADMAAATVVVLSARAYNVIALLPSFSLRGIDAHAMHPSRLSRMSASRF